MKTQPYKSNITREYFYPNPKLRERLIKKAKKEGKSKSLVVVESLEKTL